LAADIFPYEDAKQSVLWLSLGSFG